MIVGDSIHVTTKTFPGIRRRLAVEIHARGYHDIGVEVSPRGRGAELDQHHRIGTPHCKHGDRDLGHLDWHGTEWATDGRTFESWSELRTVAFAELGVHTWRNREHKGCFHRRGKARYDIVFAVAAELAGSCTHGNVWTASGDPDEAALLASVGDEILPGRQPRHLAYGCRGELLAILRTDGPAVTANGPLEVDELWWRGMSVPQISAALRQRAGHLH